MLVVLSATLMLVDFSVAIMQVTVSVELYIPYSNWHTLFIKLTRKYLYKGIISGLYFTIFVNILPKLRYLVGRSYIQIDWKSHSLLLFSWLAYKRWGHLKFLERGNLRKVEVDLEKGGMTPLTNYGCSSK